MTSSDIEPATLLLVAQCLNKLRYCGAPLNIYVQDSIHKTFYLITKYSCTKCITFFHILTTMEALGVMCSVYKIYTNNLLSKEFTK
jgi:hypothetical protein